jgi:hypothetical protein
MESFADLIERFGGAAKMALAIGELPNTIRQWAARNSIPARYWQTIVTAARDNNVRGVSHAALAELAGRRRAA